MFVMDEYKSLRGAPEVSGESLEKWLKSKGVADNYAALAREYVRLGEKYGIRGDVALCQSILETGWFWKNNTHFDVKPAQNNFAGLGATGNGVAGDSFDSPLLGIEAQIQDLSLRSDGHIPKDQVLSAYARKVYSTITDYHHTMWRQLAGTWAADITYWEQIQKLMAEYNAWEQANPLPQPPAYPEYRALTGTCSAILDFIAQLLPGQLQRVPRMEPTKPQPQPTKPGPKKRIYLNPGHSDKRPGARGLSEGVKEEVLNKLAGDVMAAALREAGHEVTLFRSEDNDLSLVGNNAAGYDVALSLHHNAFDHKEHYTCMFGAEQISEESQKLGTAICNAISKAISIKSEGVKTSGYTVPKIFADVCKGPSGLIEFYFIDAYSDTAAVSDRTTRAAKAAAQAVIDYLAKP